MRRNSVIGPAAICACLALALAAGPACAAVESVQKGADLWMTVAGSAQTSFDKDPIPAGFFCPTSQPFTGTVVFRGAPLAVEPAGSLGDIDTVVRRLDDAVFDQKGEATTRIQLMALSLVSLNPIDTSCGKYDVAVNLAGAQPTTTMRIFRTEALGGTYSAPLAFNVKAVFTPAGAKGDKGARRELTRRIELGPANHSVWAYVTSPQYREGVKIDTKGDGRPDTVLPPSSNFLAGVQPSVLKDGPPARPTFTSYPTDPGPQPCCGNGLCPYKSCHCAEPGTPGSTDPFNPGTGCDHLHCIWSCVQYANQRCACVHPL
jgi:hypothetical protein